MENPNQLNSDGSFDFWSLRERMLGLWYKTKRLVRDHGWIVLTTTGVCAALFLIGALIQGPMYVSSAKLMASGQITLPEKSVFQEERLGYFGTQMNILQSARVRQNAFERVGMLHPELKPVKVALNIKLSEEAAILKIDAIASEPQYTQAYLSALINAYQDFKKQIRAQTAEQTSLAIQDELLKLQREIDEAEAAKVEFQKKHNVTFMREQGQSVGLNLVKLKTQMAELTTQYNLLQSGDIDALPPGSEQLAGLEAFAEYMKLKSELQRSELMLGQYRKYMRPAHPKLISTEEKVLQLKSTLENLRQQSRLSLETTRASLKSQIDNLGTVIAEWEKRALEFTQSLAQFEQLDARLTRAQALYEKLVSSVQSVDMSQKLSNDLLSVLEDATPALRVPSYFLKRSALGALAGLILGGGILFVISLFDNRLSSLEELSAHLDTPVLGVIPAEKLEEGKRLALLTKDDARPVLAEAYRNLRSSLAHTQINGQTPNVWLVTSSIPGEGKTTVSANLAAALSLSGARVLAIDADLRKGRLHEDFGVENNAGLAAVLQNGASPSITQVSPTLHVLTRGQHQDHPAELLTAKNLQPLLTQLKSKYDWILIDTPPLLAAEDALLTLPFAQALLFVVRAHFTQSSQMHAALRMLKGRNFAPTGVAFNLLDLEHPNYYHYKYADYYHRSSPSA